MARQRKVSGSAAGVTPAGKSPVNKPLPKKRVAKAGAPMPPAKPQAKPNPVAKPNPAPSAKVAEPTLAAATTPSASPIAPLAATPLATATEIVKAAAELGATIVESPPLAILPAMPALVEPAAVAEPAPAKPPALRKATVAPLKGPVAKAPAAKAVVAFLPKGTPDFVSLSRDGFHAVVESNSALAEGFEQIGHEITFYAQHALDRAVSLARALIGARTLSDVLALQRSYAKTSLDELIANSARISEIGLTTTTKALKPIGTRVTGAFNGLSAPTV